MGLEPHETNRGGQNAAAPRREAQGQNRSPARKNQTHAPADPVVLPGARCRLCYRLVSNSQVLIQQKRIAILTSTVEAGAQLRAKGLVSEIDQKRRQEALLDAQQAL